jgi:hypothetical protein
MAFSRLLLWCVAAVSLAALGLAGCGPTPMQVPAAERVSLDRRYVEYPPDSQLVEIVRGLTGPVDVAFDNDGTMVVVEGGIAGREPRIFAIKSDGTQYDIYPVGRKFPVSLFNKGFQIYGPVGGIAIAENGTIFCAHRDENGLGVITAFQHDGSHRDVVGGLPARGDHGMGDIAIGPGGRLWFSCGSATNSGVVGLDNWHWVKQYETFSDRPFTDLKLRGYRFDSPNPWAGLFGGADVARTGPFQPFGVSNLSRVPAVRDDRPTAAVYSCAPGGGGLRVEAHGVRWARGIAFDEYGSPYMTNQGMQLRGTRPIFNDPDALLMVIPGNWYGWPDYSADLVPVEESRFQPQTERVMQMVIASGYRDISFLIDHGASNAPDGLFRPRRSSLLQATFPPLSGASMFSFVPGVGRLAEYRGQAIVALSGDRAPFANSGQKLVGPIGFKVARVDLLKNELHDLIRNIGVGPGSRLNLPDGVVALERPIAAKFDDEGNLYVVDFGQLVMKNGLEHVKRGTGKIFKLSSVPPATRPADEPRPAAATTGPSTVPG